MQPLLGTRITYNHFEGVFSSKNKVFRVSRYQYRSNKGCPPQKKIALILAMKKMLEEIRPSFVKDYQSQSMFQNTAVIELNFLFLCSKRQQINLKYPVSLKEKQI